MAGNLQFPTQNAQKVASIWNSDHALVDEGSYFQALTPTAGTGIAMTTSVVDDAATASSTHAQAAPLLYIQNTDIAGANGRPIFLKYFRLLQIISAQAWTSATNAQYSWRLDAGNRYTSGGTLLNVNTMNPGVGTGAGALVYFGANVTALPSASNGRMVGRGQIQGTIPLPGDQWLFTFGDVTAPTNLLGASAIKNITLPCAPICIPPGWNLALDIWATGLAAAPAFEAELGFVQRPAGQ